jgi:hypothetical protein
MKSPFPGMDPYLEAHWLDVHPRLIVAAARHLQRQLGEGMVARIEERLIVEDPLGPSRPIGPDVRVVEVGAPPAKPVRATIGAAAVAEPVVLHLEVEPVRQRYLEIRDLSTGGRVVSVIEFLSPSNKAAGDGREQYQRKQQECRAAGVNLVEVDLTRAGRRALLAQRWAQAGSNDSDYQASAWRADAPTRCEVYAIPLRGTLPAIRVPLRPADDDAVLDLQALVDQVYADSRYDLTIDYRRPCEPPLREPDEAWARGLVEQRA